MVPVAPVANFVASTLTPHVSELVTFTDLSTGTPTSRYRDFGDGFASTLQNPTHIYTVAGTYTIILIATSARGSDSEQKTAYVAVHTVNPQQFYNGYSIDDSQIGCGKVIAVDCDNLHYYVNLCDLIEECVETLPHDITKECIRDFFNTTIDSVTPGYFLRVDAQYCIEAVDITTLLQCTDIFVKTNAQDATADYLAAKFNSRTDGCMGTVVVPNGPASHQQLQVQIIYPDSPFLCDLPGLPACDGASVTIDSDGTVKYNCDDSQNRLRATLYTRSAIFIDPPTNVYKSYIFSNDARVYNTQTLTVAGHLEVPYGEPSMIGTISSIDIVKTGMYEVRMKGEAVINNGVSRMRLFVLCKPNVKSILLDCKYGGEAGPGDLPANHDMLTEGTYTFIGHGLFKLDAGDRLGLGCKIDTRDTDAGVAPHVERRESVYDLGDGTQPEIGTIGPGLSFGCKRYSPVTHGAV